MQRIRKKEYCLYCYTPIVAKPGPSQRCESCDRVHVRINQAVYWSLEPGLRKIEWWIKAGIVVFVVGLFMVLVKAVDLGPHAVNSFFIGPLVMLGGVLWWTAGLITRKPRYFSARVLWSTVLVLLVLGPPVLFFLMDVVARRESYGAEYWKGLLFMSSPAVPMIVIAGVLHFFSDRFEAFKRKRLEGV